MKNQQTFDVIVIGGGHSGTEAALAASRMGAKTLLLTQNIETIGQMSCNPSIGGIGKGHLVKEVDAMGGAMAEAIDIGGIHFRELNARKGPAVRATRAQADRVLYKQAIRRTVENQDNLSIFQQSVEDLLIENNTIKGVVTKLGLCFMAKTVVLTVGTFLGGRIHIGERQSQGGRAGDAPSNALADKLRALPFRVGRLKTGTPPRIDGKTIDYSVCTEQPGDTPLPFVSYWNDNSSIHAPQIHCHITHTTEKTRDIILANIDKSAMYSGNIEGVGPRYCPSIEDKMVRFADKPTHQIFVEPEGLHTTEVYPNGISTSLPFDVQIDFVRSIRGFENAHITRAGYAIEYDYFDPRDLQPSLETMYIEGLFFAGQINGTTGYEEAAAQGLLAGLNAARKAAGQSAWTPSRSEAYLGVLVDDLITRGTQEPYRMFTSRAEYRLMLREDNADQRLSAKAYELGLLSDAKWQKFQAKNAAIEAERERLKSICIQPTSEAGIALGKLLGQPLTREYQVMDLLKRPEISYDDIVSLPGLGAGLADKRQGQQITIGVKYAGYIDRQQQEIERHKEAELIELPTDYDYSRVKGLSSEINEKLNRIKPATIGMASRIPGMTPAAISILLVHFKGLVRVTS